MLPDGRREAAVRFAVGVVCGLVFGGTAGLKIAASLASSDDRAAEIVLMGSAAASLCAWWALGALQGAEAEVAGRLVPEAQGERTCDFFDPHSGCFANHLSPDRRRRGSWAAWLSALPLPHGVGER